MDDRARLVTDDVVLAAGRVGGDAVRRLHFQVQPAGLVAEAGELGPGGLELGGRGLLQAIVDHAHSYGAHKLELEVWPDNARAIALYKGAGFEAEGLRRDHYLPGAIDRRPARG